MLPCSSVYLVRPALDACSRILTAQGVGELQFVVTEKGEKSYLNSRLWSRREYERLLCEGASQAFCTRLPKVSVHSSLSNCLDGLEGQEDRLALDNYESSLPLGAYHPFHSRTVLAVGAERGWSAAERDRLRALDFTLANVGQRVLKTETAAIALPRGPGPPCPRPRPHRADQAGCRAGGGRRYERSVLHPSAAVGGPAGAGVFLRPQRMRDLWRAPEDRRRPDRSGLDPDLFGGHRAASGASAEGPAAAAVRVRRLTCLLDPAPGVGGVHPQRSLRPRIDPDTGRQATKLYCELGRRTGKRSSGSCLTLAVHSAL